MSRLREVELVGVISSDNSTSTILDPVGTNVFTGESEDVTDFGTIEISVYSDVASATDGLSIQFSSDGTKWDHTDAYTVPADTGKNYSVQRVAQYFRIVYTNGAVAQTEFRLQIILNPFYIKPSSHRLSDPIIGDDDATLSTTVLKVPGSVESEFVNIDIQNPLPTDGDSVYQKDVWADESIATNWVDVDGAGGEVILIPFNNIHTAIKYTGTDNPKTLRVHFNRTINLFEVALGCADHPGDNFSNVKIEVLGSGGTIQAANDDSVNNTKYTSNKYPVEPTLANAVDISFHTADDVTITNISIQKIVNVAARLQALKPDGTVADIDATAGGNLKVSIEEYDDEPNPIRKDLEGVGDIIIGTSEVEIAVTGSTTHVRIQADTGNLGTIFIGKTGVLADKTNDFVRLGAGDEVIIGYDDSSNALYAISDTTAQTINVGALL